MKKDLLSYCGRWIIEKFPALYDSYSGITNNPSKSINAVLKRMTGWQELPVDCMMLGLFHLQNYYFVECQRWRAGIGSYKLKSKYKEARLDKDDIRVPYKIVNPDEIIEYVKSAINNAELKASLKLPSKQQSVDDNKQQEENPMADYQTQSPSSTISTSHEDSPRFSDVASPTDAVQENHVPSGILENWVKNPLRSMSWIIKVWRMFQNAMRTL